MPRRLELTVSRSGATDSTIIAEAERIHGPTSPRECVFSPVVVWTERQEGKWMLQCWSQNTLQTIYVSESMLRNPSTAVVEGRIYAAVEVDDAGGSGCIVVADSGEVCFRTAGRNPVLRTAAWGLVLLCEQVGADRSGVDLFLHNLDGGPAARTLKSDDLNIHADMAYDPGSDSLFVCWESTPVWGFDPYVGRHRDINVMRLGRDGTLEPTPGTTNGRLALPRVAHLNRCDTNMPPVYSRVLAIDGNPAVAYRNYRFRAGRSFGWDVFLTRYDGRVWTGPLRVSEHPGPPDAGYTILQRRGELLGFFPCCDNDPPASPTRNHRIEVQRIGIDDGYSPEAIPLCGRGFYQIPFAVPNAAPDPPSPQPTGGRTLVWADLHQHTAQSKCMACIDGSLEDVLSFQRDILGCRVLTAGEHFH
ncbi:MAG: hypothetical protein V3S01_07125, partial [Dehalococcoidia bacterium]